MTALGGGAVLLSSCTVGSGHSPKPRTSSNGLPAIEGGRVVTDPGAVPGKFAESPEFAKRVSAGTLPPVEERVSQDPLVIKPVHSTGKYGGELRRGYLGVGDTQNANRFCAGPDNLLWWDYSFRDVVPNIAKGYEFNGDKTVLTLHLRRGMKWSDGQPFTAEDILFWYEDINLVAELSGGSAALRIQGNKVKIEKADDYTVHFVSPVPHPLLPRLLAGGADIGGMTQSGQIGGGGFAPKHYLSKFHPKYITVQEATRLAKQAGLPTWPEYFLQRNTWTLNPDLPLLTPWVTVRGINNSPWTLEANPYSVWVDTEGHQLPYIHTITMQDAGSQDVLTLKAVAGEYDFQDRGLAMSSLPVLVKGASRGGYTVHRAPSTQMDFMLRVNLAYQKDKTIGDLLRNVDFRRAISLGIDRAAINETYFLGTGVPSSTLVPDNSPYFPGPEWRTKWATHDVAQANALLDKIGLRNKDGEGYRLRPDGNGRVRLDYVSTKTFADYPAMGEAIKNQWKSIGVDLTVETVQNNLLIQRILANEVVLQGIGGGVEDPFIKRDAFLPVAGTQGAMGIPYASWFSSGGKTGIEPPADLGLKEAMDLYGRGLTASDAERTEIGKQLCKTHVDKVYSIGVVAFGLTIYGLYYAKNALGNVPDRIVNSELLKAPSNVLPMTLYYR